MAACDLVEERVSDLASQFHCAGYRDYEEMLGKTEADVMVICTPHGLHAEHTIASLEAGFFNWTTLTSVVVWFKLFVKNNVSLM